VPCSGRRCRALCPSPALVETFWRRYRAVAGPAAWSRAIGFRLQNVSKTEVDLQGLTRIDENSTTADKRSYPTSRSAVLPLQSPHRTDDTATGSGCCAIRDPEAGRRTQLDSRASRAYFRLHHFGSLGRLSIGGLSSKNHQAAFYPHDTRAAAQGSGASGIRSVHVTSPGGISCFRR